MIITLGQKQCKVFVVEYLDYMYEAYDIAVLCFNADLISSSYCNT